MLRLVHIVPSLLLAGAAAALIRAGLTQFVPAAEAVNSLASARTAVILPPVAALPGPDEPQPDSLHPDIGPDAREERCERQAAGDPPPTPNPRPEYEDLRTGIVFLCQLHEDTRPARVVMTVPEDEFTAGIRVHASGSTRPVQEISLELDHLPYRDGGEFFRGQDLNGDGWMELMVMTSGGSIGTMYAVYTYDPERRRFVRDSVFDMGANIERIPGTRCARSLGAGGANSYVAEDFCWGEGRWVLTRLQTQERDFSQPWQSGIYLRSIEEMREGRMQLVQVDTVRVYVGR